MTRPLTDNERSVILPKMAAIMREHIGGAMAITAHHIEWELTREGYRVDVKMIPAMIAELTTSGQVPGLVCWAGGWYVAETAEEIAAYVRALRATAQLKNTLAASLSMQARDFPRRAAGTEKQGQLL